MRFRRGWSALHYQHAIVGVLLLSCLLYAGLIVGWTLQSPNTVSKQEFQATRPSVTTLPRPEKTNTEAFGVSLLRGHDQQLSSGNFPQAVMDSPSNSPQGRRLTCLGWRATANCSPNGSRLPQNDQDCSSSIPDGTSGYCEVKDLDSNESFKVMKRTCDRGYKGTVLRCSEAPGFANFRAKAQQVIDKVLVPGYTLPKMDGPLQGIVMVVYPKLVASVYATVRALREVLGCQLPIEIWMRPDEMNKVPGALEPLFDLARNKSFGEITFEAIRHRQAVLFNSKIYSLYNSKFQQVLFLDADNAPVKDPSYLFSTAEFQKTGAIFWPDYWHPEHTIFGINQTSLLWQLLDLPFVDMLEQDSGQLLIDRKRHAGPLALVLFYGFHSPNYFNKLKLAWGDKDLFRFAWLKLGASFHMIETLPAVAGEVTGQWFCGMTMAQHDPKGEVLFLHRNQLKLTGDAKLGKFDSRLKKVFGNSPKLILSEDGYPDPAIWTHLVSFRKDAPRTEYTIERHAAMNRFTGLQRCFGGRELHKKPHFHTQKFEDLNFAGLELKLRQYALAGARLQQKKRS
ncbi:hypothetical protein V7S43_016367 [Phytophthora oleae]|uniref:Nucleotide-diphospho-sugar transferase n=1 Tax=Phytophthora oleae TaxID=2107226 RepID=A0ABD3EYF7_9STRA